VNQHKQNGLVRSLGLPGALSIGLGTMLGAGIFVLSGSAAEQAGPGAALSFAIAGLICLPIAMSISELATAMPQAGGSYHLISRTLGPLAGSIVGPANWLGLTFATGFYLIGFAEYTTEFIAIPHWLSTVVLGLGFTWLNYRGARVSGSLQVIIVAILVAILGWFAVRGFFNIDSQLHEPFLPEGWDAVIANVGLIIVSFTGFEKISTVAQEIKKPGRNLPIAIIGSVVIATGIYSLILYVATGIVSYEQINEFDAPLVDTAQRFMTSIGAGAMWVAALLAMASSANAAILTSSRINFAMGRDRILPSWFGKVHPQHQTPHCSVLTTGGLAIALGLSGQAETLAEISSAMFMVSYALLTIGLVVMRRSSPEWYQPQFRVPLFPWLPVAGGIASLLVILVMDWVSQVAGIGLALLGTLWYFFWARDRTSVKGELHK